MKMDAEYNETIPAISRDRFHDDFPKITSKIRPERLLDQHVELEKNQRQTCSTYTKHGRVRSTLQKQILPEIQKTKKT